jgi:hypothetical protein
MKHTIRNNRFIGVLVFAAIVLFATPNLKAQKVAEQDSLALVAFYNATDGPNWISNQDDFSFDNIKDDFDLYYRENPGTGIKWFSGPVKNWFGVRVRKMPNESATDSVLRVVELRPVMGRRENGQNKLKGYIPREVGMLTALEVLILDGNDGFKGSEIPDEIFSPSLIEFHVEKCSFNGGISDAIKKCTNLRKINLRYNNLYYVPALDFMKEENFRAGGIQWFYSTNISFEYLEPTIDYFYSLSPNIKEFGIEARDNTNVGVEREIVAQVGQPVTITITDAGSQGTVSWYKNGLNTFKKGRDYVIASVKETDYADYYGRLENNYVKLYDSNPNYGPHDTKLIHLVKAPVAPLCLNAETSYDGKGVMLYFSKPMAKPNASEINNFSVSTGAGSISVEAFSLSGKNNDRIQLILSAPIEKDQNVSINYTPGNVLCANGGLLGAISNLSVFNKTRGIPVVDSITTTTGGTGILLTLNNFVDPASLVAANFQVNDGAENPVVSVTTARGQVNNAISKTILLNLSNQLNGDQTITLAYNQGSLKALNGGMLESFAPQTVENIVQENRAEVIFKFTDGKHLFDNIYIGGNISLVPQAMYDNGTHGDETAGDHIWTSTLSLADGDYYWEVINRKQEASFDTVTTVNEQTGAITMIITPTIENVDSLVSSGYNLNLSVAKAVTNGITSFGIADKSITFNLDMSHYSKEITGVYLMGINNDWSEGLLMEALGNKQFSRSVSLFTVGDHLEFNFRNGEDWENVTLSGRNYTVKEGENVLNLAFADFTTSSNENQLRTIKVYPNPTYNILTISESQEVQKIYLLNLAGQIVNAVENNIGSSRMEIDMSFLKSGIYLLYLKNMDGTHSTHKINKY